MAPRNPSSGLIKAYVLAGLNRLERAFLRRARLLTRQRVQRGRSLVQEVLRTGRVPAQLQLPGTDEFEQLCRRFLLEAWALGFQHGEREVDSLRRRRRTVRFLADPELSGLPARAREDVQRRLGRLLDWGRGWDSAVHQVVVNAVEVRASPDQVERALDAQAVRLTGPRLAVLARTEETAAYNAGRLGSFRSQSWLVEAVQFIGTTDERTTDVCRSRAGLIMGLDDPRLVGMTPPLHYGCRSVLVPVDKFDMQALRAGDPAVERRVFRNQPPGAPQSLEQAMDGWKDAPRPPSGFGDAKDLAGGGPPKSGKGGGVSEPPGGTGGGGGYDRDEFKRQVERQIRQGLPSNSFEFEVGKLGVENREVGDRYVLGTGAQEAYNIGLSPGYLAKLQSEEKLLFYHQYVEHTEHGAELVAAFRDAGLPFQFGVEHQASSVIWNEEWETDAPGIRTEQTPGGLVARSVQYALVFPVKDQQHAEQMLAVIAEGFSEGGYSNSWSVPDVRVTGIQSATGAFMVRSNLLQGGLLDGGRVATLSKYDIAQVAPSVVESLQMILVNEGLGEFIR